MRSVSRTIKEQAEVLLQEAWEVWAAWEVWVVWVGWEVCSGVGEEEQGVMEAWAKCSTRLTWLN